MNLLEKTVSKVQPLDTSWQEKAMDYLDSLAMPPGALGQVHDVAVRLCGILKTLKPQITRKSLVLSAADHGVAAQGVSHYPQITGAIVRTALNGGAAINSFCRQAGCQLIVVDAGLVEDLSSHPDLICLPIGRGTADMSLGPAMSSEDCEKALNNGILFAEKLSAENDILALGEMGIANTTAATAVVAALTGWPVTDITGPGTGVQGEALENKKQIIAKALELNSPLKEQPLDTLRKVGGFEIAFMTGLIIGWSAVGKPLILDGFITGAAALAAVRLSPLSSAYLFAGHQSAEPAHAAVLQELGLSPLLQLNMRLGEGLGAAQAMAILDSAVDVLQNMMTLDEALKL